MGGGGAAGQESAGSSSKGRAPGCATGGKPRGRGGPSEVGAV